MSAAWLAYRMIAPALGTIAPHARLFVSAAERSAWGERMGRSDVPGGCSAWIHAASMGEATAAACLARELAARAPEAQLLLTTTTRTARARLAAQLPRVALAPIDSPQAVRRFLAGVSPARLFVVETEIWPHWLMAARAAGIPVAFVSARLSNRSVAGYRRLGGALRDLIAGASCVLCQSEADAERWRGLGARPERTRVTGNLKFDALELPEPDRGAARAKLGLDAARPALTLGSLRPGEARPLAIAWRALPAPLRERWQVIAVPRHARALAGLLEEARREGVGAAGDERPRAETWRWDARPGVLGGYYGASEAAFVGASLVPLGGHNPLEPAARGAAVLMGRFGSHQQQAVERMREQGGIVIANQAELPAALARLLGDEAARATTAQGGLRAVATLRGATARTVHDLEAHGLWPVL